MASHPLLEVIKWSAFQRGIAPLWRADNPADIPILNNPFGIIQYSDLEMRDRIIFKPCCLMVEGEPVGYTSVYNISDTTIRIRGIYILPEHQKKGYGHIIWRKAAELFPMSFNRVVGFWREDSAPVFMKKSGLKIVPGTDWFWSDFSKVNLRYLYWDRAPEGDEKASREFIYQQHNDFGFGGSNNLDRSWDDSEWLRFSAK